MSKAKIIALIGLIAFAFSMTAIGNALAGEKVKLRNAWYMTKWQQLETGHEEGHVVALIERKGICSNMEGKALFEGMVGTHAGFVDMNLKTGLGSGKGYCIYTDKDGDKIYEMWEGKNVGQGWRGPSTLLKGTGKYEGIKAKGTWIFYPVSPTQAYADWELDVELPGR